MPHRGAVLGYDVGWSLERPSSAACLLAWDEDGIRLDLRRFTARPEAVREALRALAGGRSLLAAAFDGPLGPRLRRLDLYRPAERILTRGLARHIGKPGPCNVPNGRRLNEAATAAARAVLALGGVGPAGHAAAIHPRALVEAFPTSFLGMLLDPGEAGRAPRRARSDIHYTRATAGPRDGRLGALVRALLPGRRVATRLAGITDHDERAAVACAVTALCVALGRYAAVGDAAHGFVVLPPPAPRPGAPGLQPWALAILAANAGPGGLVIEGG